MILFLKEFERKPEDSEFKSPIETNDGRDLGIKFKFQLVGLLLILIMNGGRVFKNFS